MRKHWLMWSLAAVLVVSAGCKSMGDHDGDEDNDEHETKVSINDVPVPVRATLMAQAPGAAIKTVDHEMQGGKWLYEADAMVDGKNWEILVAEDGKLISKKLDDEKDDDEKNEKNGKHEKED